MSKRFVVPIQVYVSVNAKDAEQAWSDVYQALNDRLALFVEDAGFERPEMNVDEPELIDEDEECEE